MFHMLICHLYIFFGQVSIRISGWACFITSLLLSFHFHKVAKIKPICSSSGPRKRQNLPQVVQISHVTKGTAYRGVAVSGAPRDP